MKCDKFTTPVKIEIPGIGTIESKDLLLKVEVYEAIAELKARIHELESIPHTDNSAVIELLENENKNLKDKLRHYPKMAAIIEADKKELAELREATRWRTCSEELPEEGVEVLVTNGIDCGISDWCGDYWNNDPFCGYTVCDNVIAWMPLPKAPEVK